MGVLKVDHRVDVDQARIRVIFYAQQTTFDVPLKLKRVPDKWSLEAWVNMKEATALAHDGRGLRGDE